jgi:hypothetical protein
MRNLKITVIVDPDLDGLLEAGAKREGRSKSNYIGRLLREGTAREAARVEQVEQVEQRQGAAA